MISCVDASIRGLRLHGDTPRTARLYYSYLEIRKYKDKPTLSRFILTDLVFAYIPYYEIKEQRCW